MARNVRLVARGFYRLAGYPLAYYRLALYLLG